MQDNTFSVSSAFEQAWSWWQKENKYVYYLLLPGAIAAVVSALFMQMGMIFSFLSFLIEIFAIFLSMCVTASLLFFVNSGQKEEWEDWKKYGKLFFRFLLLNILLGIMVFVGILLLIIPGIYLAVRYGFASYHFLEHPETKIEDAFRASSNLTEGNRMAIFLTMLVAGIGAGLAIGITSAIFGFSPLVQSIVTEVASYLVAIPLVTLVGLSTYTLLKKKTATVETVSAVTEETAPAEVSPVAVPPLAAE